MQVALQSQAGANGPPKLYIMDDMALKVSVNMAGYIYIYITLPAGTCPALARKHFFLEMRAKKSKESAVISSQLDHGVGLGSLPKSILVFPEFLTTVDFPCSGKESCKLCIHRPSRPRTGLLQ